MADAKTKAAPTIHSKLLEFQKLNISIKKSKENPHFKNKYADLSEIISKVRPALNQVGIVLIQLPGEAGLTTILQDAEGDTCVTGFLPYIGATDAQKLGSNLTYLRRYSLVTLLGLEDDDDDGTKAVEKTATAAPAKKAAPDLTLDQACRKLKASISVEDLTATFKSFPIELRKDEEVIAMAKEVKEEIINAQEI
ncbi:ERF family protein [Seohaeicola saemankumensis]|uniref:ERF family protein n=1 Tax=Seohaeicola saemankumensis TaxID=481181 RepID=UPI001E5F1A6C|nr:ERF family protein [Seohaeicola saemankumensis]MCD1627040.1 ERF family protein [Seohaeicola saemankumensis]